MRLNLGCGKDILEGYVNVDRLPGEGIDMVAELDHPERVVLWHKPVVPLPDDSVDEFLVSHLVEHVRYPLPLLEEMWRVAKPGAKALFRCPYGSSDDADEDPTHVRHMFAGSWQAFSQPYYWRADYGYKGDWKATRVALFCDPGRVAGSPEVTWQRVRRERNVVQEMVAELVAVKPARPADRELLEQPPLEIGVAE